MYIFTNETFAWGGEKMLPDHFSMPTQKTKSVAYETISY